MPSSLVEVSLRVSAALAAGEPVVALESTIISHGLPRPGNLAAAQRFEQILQQHNVTPATIALIDGVPKVGLDAKDLERIAGDESVVKVGSRDIAIAIARKVTGGTTVAATSVLAARAGLRVFATGGLGGILAGRGMADLASSRGWSGAFLVLAGVAWCSSLASAALVVAQRGTGDRPRLVARTDLSSLNVMEGKEQLA